MDPEELDVVEAHGLTVASAIRSAGEDVARSIHTIAERLSLTEFTSDVSDVASALDQIGYALTRIADAMEKKP